MHVEVGPAPLSADTVVAAARGRAELTLSDPSLAAIREGHDVVARLSRDSSPHYGISTGFGALATRHIPVQRRLDVERSLIRSHAASSGREIDIEVIRAMMLLRLSTLASGRTGVRPEVATAYAAMISAGITPVVGEYGSLGCSGDL